MKSQNISNNIISRRSALAGMAGLTCGALSDSLLHAIEPFRLGGEPHFKFSLAAYSYRGLLTNKEKEFTLFDFIDECAAMGLDGTELTSYYFNPAQPDDAYLYNLKSHAFKKGLSISGTAIRDDLCYPAGEKREQEIAHVMKWIEYAAKLDAPVIRIFSGKQRKDQTVEEATRLAIEGIEKCCDYAGKHGVYLALENHGGLTATPAGMLEIVKAVKSPWFGVNVDTGNFHGKDVYAELAEIAPYALNVQVKVAFKPASGKKEETDFGRIAKILRDTGYRGFVVLEYEESEDPRSACRKYFPELRKAFA
jgi:sugar phosphate isomerase/epimerase